MPKLVIIGQSPAAYSAIRALRAADAGWSITLIATDGQLPYDRGRFTDFIGRRIKEKDIFCSTEDFYKEGKVELILDKEISRINFNRRKVYLSERVQVDYDALLMTDAPQVRLPEIKGVRRPGVFDMARLDSMRRLSRQMIDIETALVVPVSLRGIAMAVALRDGGKEVALVLPGEADAAAAQFGVSADVLSGSIEKNGLRVVANNTIADILGDGQVQAVRLKSGKVMACEALILEAVVPDLRFLADTDLLMRERICVHVSMQTNIADVYAVDAVMEMPVAADAAAGDRETPDPGCAGALVGSYGMDSESAMDQGERAVRAMLGSHSAAEGRGITEGAL